MFLREVKNFHGALRESKSRRLGQTRDLLHPKQKCGKKTELSFIPLDQRPVRKLADVKN
jgi:hypothetical protein